MKNLVYSINCLILFGFFWSAELRAECTLLAWSGKDCCATWDSQQQECLVTGAPLYPVCDPNGRPPLEEHKTFNLKSKIEQKYCILAIQCYVHTPACSRMLP